MVDDQVHIPLGKKFKACAFGQYHPEHGMYVFDTAFLTTAHRITVIDTLSDYAINTSLQCSGIAKLGSPVSQDCVKKAQEIISTVLLFHPVKDHADGTLCTAAHQECQKEFSRFRKKVRRTFFYSLEE